MNGRRSCSADTRCLRSGKCGAWSGRSVGKFMDFEGEWGFENGTATCATKAHPAQVGAWIAHGRKWNAPPCLGDMGTQETEDSWVGRWWSWWMSLQLEERGEEMLRTETVDWSGLFMMYGKNGLLQVMATLSWWGGAIHRRGGAAENVDNIQLWVAALDDVTWVLGEILASGKIG
ncbi:hypothetical protein K438DRAFT_1564011 [Mycena galopus ATCC 62051]|nr:hypothetical protein K438DRAFT_1601065 [Mycena galopus ATCC 62051]KAF8214203.1 hypothetical protein K438DRAFT_1564011 [Mycena galopus ATCC 62051]